MTIWCSICDVRGHATTDCWYKPKYIKEIRKENGKPKKSIQLHPNKTRNLISIDTQIIEVEVERLHLPELKQENAETKNQKKIQQKQKISENHLQRVPHIKQRM